MKQFREIHVVSNTHWDREFRFPFQRTRKLLVRMMDYLLDLLEKCPDYTSYTMDAHTILLEDYLDARPENRERIQKLVRDKRLFVGPWYTLPDIPNIGQEAVVRNLLYGHKVSESLGRVMKVGYTPCSWGQTGQLPQIYSHFDIDSILFYRGISPHECHSEFIWESPDGTQALAHRFALFARYNYYYLVFRKITYGLDINDRQWWWGDNDETPYKAADSDKDYSTVELLDPEVLYKKENLKPAIEEMLRIEGPHYTGPCFLAMHGHDISWPHPKEPEVVRDADEAFPDMKIVMSDLETYFDSLKNHLDMSDLEVLKGERRTNLKEGFWTYLLPGTVSARTRLKQQNFRTESMLVNQAEPSSVMNWMLGEEQYPSRYLDKAWRHLMCTHTHDANAGCAPDEITEDVRYHLRQSIQLGEELVQDFLKCLAMNVDAGDADPKTRLLAIYNPLPFERTELVEALVDLPDEESPESLIIRDPDGNICDYQPIKESGSGLFVDTPWNVPQAFITKRFRIRFLAENIPSMGYRVYTVESAEKPDRKSGSLFTRPEVMENENIRVQARPNGAVIIEDLKSGAKYPGMLLLEDSGEVGNAWKHETPSDNRIIYSSGANARIQKVEDGPLSATMRIDLVLTVPAECPDDQKRSDQETNIPVTHFVTLEKHAEKVDIVTRFDNRARDHRLRMLFPTGLTKAETSCADSHFDVVERPVSLPNRDDWKEPVVGTYPYRSFVDVSDGNHGLCVMSEGLQEFEVTRDKSRAIALTLVRSIRIKLEVSEQRKQELPDAGPQSPGIHEFRMAVYPHTGNWNEAGCPKKALTLGVPLRVAQFGPSQNSALPRELSFLKCTNDAIEISALKKAERADAVVLRLYNPSSVKQEGEIELHCNIGKLSIVNMNEETREECEHKKNKFSVKLAPKKIRTYLVEPE